MKARFISFILIAFLAGCAASGSDPSGGKGAKDSLLSASAGELNPAFNPKIAVYELRLPYEVEEVTLSYTRNGAALGTRTISALAEGRTAVEFEAANTVWTVGVIRLPSVRIASLSISGGNIGAPQSLVFPGEKKENGNYLIAQQFAAYAGSPGATAFALTLEDAEATIEFDGGLADVQTNNFNKEVTAAKPLTGIIKVTNEKDYSGARYSDERLYDFNITRTP